MKAVFSSVFYFASVPLYQGFLMVGWVAVSRSSVQLIRNKTHVNTL